MAGQEPVYRRENADDGSYYEADCGCEIWTQDQAFVIDPCSATCENYRNALQMSRERANTIQYRYRSE